jgi:predicted transcriptional regulator
MSRNPVAHALNHSTRRRIIEALWQSHEALTADQFHSEYREDERVGLNQIVYHVRQLDKDGIVQFDGDQAVGMEGRSFALAGPHSSEAVRQLQLTGR